MSKKVRFGVITLLVLAAVATIAALAMNLRGQPAEAPAVASTPSLDALADFATINASAPISPCTFDKPVAKAATSTSSLDAYTFGEPQIILTQTEQTGLGIYGWLPDSQKLLIWETHPVTTGQTILVYDLRSKTAEVYGGHSGVTGATWLLSENGVLFGDFSAADINKIDLWVGYGDKKPKKLIASDLKNSYFSLAPSQRTVVYSSNTKRGESIIAEVARPDNQKAFVTGLMPAQTWTRDWSYFVWSKDGKKMVVSRFDEAYFKLTADAKKPLCRLDWGTYQRNKLWALPNTLSFSPSQKYLSAVVTYGAEMPFPVGLAVTINLETGERTSTEFKYSPVNSVSWASEDVAVLTVSEPDRSPRQHLVLLDASTGITKPMLTAHTFSSTGDALWSPDAKKIALKCSYLPDNPKEAVQYKLCTIDVSKK